MDLTPPWVGVALVNGTTYLFDQRIMDALAEALPGASPEEIAQAVAEYLDANPVTVSSNDITDATTTGKAVLTAASQTAARTAIGAGTSNLALGTTAGTAKAGDYQPAAGDVTGLAESVRDTMGTALVAGPNVTITMDDTGDTITISSSGGGGGGAVDSVNSKIGVVTLNQDEIPDGTVAKQYTQTEKNKLAGIASGATANQSDATTNAAIALKAPINSPAFTGTPTGITKAHVGLGNVDNTADTAKPVSTAQAAADAAVQGFAIQRGNHTGTQAQSTVTNLVSDLSAMNSAIAAASAGVRTYISTTEPTDPGPLFWIKDLGSGNYAMVVKTP